MAGDPSSSKYPGMYKHTSLRPAFASKKIQVRKEVEAYPVLSLVADVGGVLGLFIGFNFLMLWDWIVLCLEKFCSKT